MAEATSCEPISHAVHLCIDMQNIFSSAGIWPTPWMDRVLPGIVRLVAHDPARTVFTRFVTPNSAHDRPGRWQRYFTRWDCATRPRLPAGALDFVSPLARFIPPAAVIDKPGYSAFFASPLQSFLAKKEISSLVVSGSETDVCVLATVLDAVDHGYRVVVVEDGLCSSSDQGHDALMTLSARASPIRSSCLGLKRLSGSGARLREVGPCRSMRRLCQTSPWNPASPRGLRRKACQMRSGRRIVGDCHVRAVRRKQADRKSFSYRKGGWEAALIEGLVTDVPVADEEGGQILPKGYHVKPVDEPS